VAALVRRPGEAQRPARTALTLTLLWSCLLYAVIFLGAPAFCAAMHAPDASSLVKLLGVIVLIDGLSAVPTGLLTRALRQDLRAVCEITGLVVTVTVSLVLALNGQGAWSLAWGRVAGNSVNAVMVWWVSPLRAWPAFDLDIARELVPIGLPLGGASLLTFGLLNVDNVIVGSALGPAALGFYALAFNLSSWPVNLISQIARRVSLAGFARLVDDLQALRRGFAGAFVLLMALTLPTCLMLSVLAKPLISVLYGARWAPSAGALRYLAVLGVVRVAAYLVEDLLAAVGHARTVFFLQASWLVLLVPSLLIGAQLGGLTGVAVGQAAVGIAMVPLLLASAHRAGIRIGDVANRLPALAGAAAAAGVAAVLLLAVVPGDLRRVLLVGTAGLGVYVALVAASPGLRSVIRSRGTAIGR
jgi:O-antigen/teichoic acid export membrane protein